MSGDLPDLPVVFLHAFPLHGEMWDGQRASLSGRRTLAPDLPGFGSRVAGTEGLDGFAATVIEEMDAAGIERAVLVGLSMGGYVAFRLWAGWPERIAGLVFADTRAGPDSSEAAAKRTEQAERARAEGTGWLAEAMLPNLLGPTTLRERPRVVERVRGMVEAASAEGVANALLAMRARPDSRPLLSGIDVPTLVIVGDEDSLTDEGEARVIAEGIRGARLAVIPGAGHLSNLENPAAFDEALRSFLE